MKKLLITLLLISPFSFADTDCAEVAHHAGLISDQWEGGTNLKGWEKARKKAQNVLTKHEARLANSFALEIQAGMITGKPVNYRLVYSRCVKLEKGEVD